MRSVAIMQPYVFPYLGYLHLIEASDVFVFYDDVAFIKGGWINRNRILAGGAPQRITAPLAGAGPHRSIAEIDLADPARLRRKLLGTLTAAYGRAAHFGQGMHYVETVFDTEPRTVADLAVASVRVFYEGIVGREPRLMTASRDFAGTKGQGRVARIAAIARALGGTRYVNAPGGRALYAPADFAPHGIELRFLESEFPAYPQVGGGAFVPGLSLIDLAMHCGPEEIRAQLGAYRLAD